jgi:hypothetical protein
MDKIPLLQAIKQINISPTQGRYWLKLLDVAIEKKGRIAYIPGDSLRLLSAMKKNISAGNSPATAATEVKNIHAMPKEIEPKVNQGNFNQVIIERLADLEKAVLLVAESNRKLSEDNKSLAALILSQNEKINNLSAKLLPPPQSKPVQVWQPAPKKAVNFSWLKRAWYELTNPARLRATP